MLPDEHAARVILARHAGLSPEALQPGDGLADIGVDSLKFIVMILEIEQRLARKVFDVNNVGNLRTVGDLLAVVAAPPGA